MRRQGVPLGRELSPCKCPLTSISAPRQLGVGTAALLPPATPPVEGGGWQARRAPLWGASML